MSKQGEIKIINKLLQDLTQYSSVKLFEDALDEVMESYGNRIEMYKVLALDDDAINNWERAVNNCFNILYGMDTSASPELVNEVEEYVPPVQSVSAYKELKPAIFSETDTERRQRLHREFAEVFGY
jgi:hypothetical protein